MSPLPEALDGLPEDGLIAVLEDRDGARGLIALSHGTIDALVEVQTTGRVDPTELAAAARHPHRRGAVPRFHRPLLAAFSRETRKVEDRDWPGRMSFGSRIADPGQLNLLLPDRTYHRLTAGDDRWARTARAGQAVLVVPRTRRPRRAPCRLGRDGARGRGARRWRLRWRRRGSAPRRGLVRTTRSLREVEALAPGDLIEFDPSDLASVRLETPSGRAVLRGRLGQIGGQRAFRMTSGDSRPAAMPGAGDRREDLMTGRHAGPCRHAPDVDGRRAGTPIARTRARGPDPVHGSRGPSRARWTTPNSRRRPRRWISRRTARSTRRLARSDPRRPGHCNRRWAAAVSRAQENASEGRGRHVG
jgi:flagellar motor switch protein FliM